MIRILVVATLILQASELVFNRPEKATVYQENLNEAGRMLIGKMLETTSVTPTESLHLMMYGIEIVDSPVMGGNFATRVLTGELAGNAEIDLYTDPYQELMYRELGITLADKVPGEDMAYFARQMDVPYVLSGSIMPVDDRVFPTGKDARDRYRLTLQLVEANSGVVAWAGETGFVFEHDKPLTAW